MPRRQEGQQCCQMPLLSPRSSHPQRAFIFSVLPCVFSDRLISLSVSLAFSTPSPSAPPLLVVFLLSPMVNAAFHPWTVAVRFSVSSVQTPNLTALLPAERAGKYAYRRAPLSRAPLEHKVFSTTTARVKNAGDRALPLPPQCAVLFSRVARLRTTETRIVRVYGCSGDGVGRLRRDWVNENAEESDSSNADSLSSFSPRVLYLFIVA